MPELSITRCTDVVVAPDPRRVIAKPFVPGEGQPPGGGTRSEVTLARILALPEPEVAETLAAVRAEFAGRHRAFDAILDAAFDDVAARLAIPAGPSADRRRLIGAYFTHEHAIEAAALGNPSMVAGPDQSGLAPGATRFVMSLRAIGEGHVSCVEFRSGTLGADLSVTLDSPSRYATTGQRGIDPAIATGTDHQLRWLASSNYQVTFERNSELSERVIFPAGPTESHGMEDVRLVRFVHDDGAVVYYGTYTAFDGRRVLPQLIETDDFSTFRVSTLAGPGARNKGIALFPRKLAGRFAALGRHDNVNNFLMTSSDVRVWHETEKIQEPKRPWELVQLGNCGSPLETTAGWLVITHGVGPMRRYSLGALLLDLDDPGAVIGHLREPLLVPEGDEREGYVPNVVYSCGSMLHGEHLVVPYGFADVGASVAVVPLADLLERLCP